MEPARPNINAVPGGTPGRPPLPSYFAATSPVVPARSQESEVEMLRSEVQSMRAEMQRNQSISFEAQVEQLRDELRQGLDDNM